MPAARILEILLQTIVVSSERYIEVSTTPTQANTPAKTGTALGHGTILPYPSQICSLCSLIWTEQIDSRIAWNGKIQTFKPIPGRCPRGFILKRYISLTPF